MLIKNWKLHYEGFPPLDCQVPCTLYGTLLQHGFIEDPYYGLNEKRYTALSEKDCTFEGCFEASSQILDREYVYLTFYGLDTICDIYLNGRKLASVNNMHRTYSYCVKDYLISGQNIIKLCFKSPIRYITEQNNKHFIWNNADTIPGAAHIRKSICMFGWDWAPQLPDMGIFRDVALDAYDTDKIDDVFVQQHHRNGQVDLAVTVATKQCANTEIFVTVDGNRVKAENGKATVRIKDPKLWWVRGYGQQPLYDVKTELVYNGRLIDERTTRIGLRTLCVNTVNGRDNGEFCIVNNGVKIFAFGANYVPQDSILSNTSPERNARLLNSCVDANFNCLRIWGGGYYPDDDIYDFCDEAGIIIWQDFMTACYGFRLTEEFKENYMHEAIDNIKRFRNHACLGLFCGNNELERNIVKEPELIGTELVKQDYLELFERLLPALVAQYAPQTFYWPSSPSAGGGYVDVMNEEKGDTHFYTPYVNYEDHTFRFCSEYGFNAFPSYKTMASVAPAQDRNPFSLVIENHQKSPSANQKVLQYIADTYRMPYCFEDLIYASQLFQAGAIAHAVKYFRSLRPVCMGSLYWQLNDCWPCASWSSVDYYGRYKALHYAAKHFYAPVALGVFVKGNHVRVNLANETMTAFHGKLTVSLRRADNQVIRMETVAVQAEKLTSKDVFLSEYNPEDRYANYIDAKLYDESGVPIAEDTALFVKPKHFSFMQPSISTVFEKEGDTVTMRLKSDVLAKNVYLDFADFDCILSDNFFDITDSTEKIITFQSGQPLEALAENLQIKTVYDIGR